MANPRTSVGYEGIDAVLITLTVDNSTIVFDKTKSRGCVSVDLAVTLSASGTVALCADGDPILGRLDSVEADNKCAVQVEGFTTLPGGLSATLTVGRKAVGALGASSAKGYVRVVAPGTAAEAAAPGPVIIDSGTATAVVVMF